MIGKRITINEEKAVFADIKSAVSLAMFDSELSRYDGSIDTDVRRAVMYNKLVFENLVKRIFSYSQSKEGKKYNLNEKSVLEMLKKEATVMWKDKVYFVEEPTEETFYFLKDILDKDRKVRGYSEYILFSLFNHYMDYIKN